MREREYVRAAARATDLCAQSLVEVRINTLTLESSDALDGSTTALAASPLGRLESDDGLDRLDTLEHARSGIHHRVELHVMNHARHLQIAGHGNEPALAQIDQVGSNAEVPVAALIDGDDQRAAVKRMSRDSDLHVQQSTPGEGGLIYTPTRP